MKKLLWIFLVLVLLGAGTAWLGRGKGGAQDRSWRTEKAVTGELLVTVSASGSVEPVESVQIGSQVSGLVKEVLVASDESVKKGQILARLDAELLDNERRDREINLKQMDNAIEQLELEKEGLSIRTKRLKMNVEHQTIAVAQSKASMELAKKNQERYTDLFRVSATSQTELDLKTLEHENSQRESELKKLDLDQIQLDLAQLRSDQATLDVRIGKAKLDRELTAQALEKAKTNLKYTEIFSPRDGVVIERAVDPGMTIAAQFNTPNLFKIIAPLSTLRITALIDEADVGKVRPDQHVTFEVDAFRGEKFSGKVQLVKLKHETRSNLVTYPVLIEALNPPAEGFPRGKLRPGMTAYLTFEVERKKNIVKIPVAALRFVPPEGVKAEAGMALTKAKDKKDTKDEKDPKAENAEKADKDEELPGLPAQVHIFVPGKGLKSLPIRVGESDGKYYELIAGDVKADQALVVGEKDLLILNPPPNGGADVDVAP